MSLRDAAGYTLTELLVALALLLLALTMFGSALAVVQRTSVVQLDDGVAMSQARQALASLDAQMRSGFGVNFVPPGSGYVHRFVIYTPTSGVGQCVGWRLSSADAQGMQVLQSARWQADQSASTATWVTMASDIRNSVVEPLIPGADPPAFVLRGYPDSDPLTGIALGVRLWVDPDEDTSDKKARLFVSTFSTRNVRRYDTKISINGADVKAYQACS